MGVEIFIRNITPEDAISWIAPTLGGVVLALVDDGIRYMHASADEETKLVVIPKMEYPEFLSIGVGGPLCPWNKSEQLAISCCEELGKTVRWCDEETNEFMEKRPGEPPEFVSWGP